MRDVFALDAGLSTGMAHARVNTHGEVEIVDLKQWKTHWIGSVDRILGMLTNAQGPDFTLVYERFDLRPGNKFLADLTTVKINSAVEYEAYRQEWLSNRCTLVAQTPAQAKSLVKDTVLKALGWWPTGKTVGQPDADDARDALRHLVHYEVRTRSNLWLTKAAWPK